MHHDHRLLYAELFHLGLRLQVLLSMGCLLHILSTSFASQGKIICIDYFSLRDDFAPLN